jgi:hypothetical protein
MATWLRREVILPAHILLCMTAPLSWPIYTTCTQILNLFISWLAHTAFRHFQLFHPTARPFTVMNSLMVLLSLGLQATQVQNTTILLMRLLYREGSLVWYEAQPEFFCLLLSPTL